jgi:RimJ/RimL family protein N-acetyltransferase
MQLETTRLTICLAERQHLTVDPRDLLEIFNSNPDFIADSLAHGKHRFTLDEVRAWQFFNGPDRPNQRYFTLRLKPGEELIGFGDLLTPHPRRPLAALGLLILHRDWHGRGAGREAALAIERQLAQEHWPEIELVVQHSRPRSRCFWESLGYTLVGDDISESGLQSWTLRKSLSPEMS